ncbi:glycosyltransferase family 2 protein [Aestuariicella hydrocarbonica]|uniref:Glycosyltransferase family 2 protein n=1 Tax=Pseudomaricurvus hydrocarbonicus TaxID=1470433 RepID=A0A9E5JV30_9GAMM|nr:glycosyltransferase family 2 protein [Aestuariicella hydrocarbonica]NHO65100.1 glycosyltransferase family 2 protein [Aestuariicella hydrocarbonica]
MASVAVNKDLGVCVKNYPLVSVIIPVYNCEKYISQALSSILRQSYTNLEVLLCDDASIDTSLSVIKNVKDDRIRIYQNSQNLGYLNTVNKLFDYCRGEFITFQDADDWSGPDRIERLVNKFEQDVELMLCGSQSKKHLSSGATQLSRYPMSDTEIRKRLNRGETALFCGASIMVRKQVLESIGVYNPIFSRVGAEDIDWYLKVLEHWKCENLPVPLYHYRQHGESFTQTLNASVNGFAADVALALHMLRDEGGNPLQDVQKKYLCNKFNELKFTLEKSSDRVKLLAFYGNYSLSFKTFINGVDGTEDRPKLLASALVALVYMVLHPLLPSSLIREIVSRKRKKRAQRIKKNLIGLS